MEVKPGYKQTEVGVIPEDWEDAPLGELAEIRMCKRIFSEQTDPSGDIPFFKIGTFGGVPDAFISGDLYREYRRKYSFPQKGDVLLSAAGTLGRTVVYDGKDAYFQDSNIVWLDVGRGKVVNEYLYQCYQKIGWASPEGSTISRLYNGIIRKTKIPLPPTESEQRAIATALSDMDALLDGLDRLIAKKRAIKQAAMQQLLTGQTRLPGFSGEWKEKCLGDCLLAPPDYGINAPAVIYSAALPTYIRITDINDDGHFMPSPKVSVNSPFSSDYLLKDGDIVFARTGASVGKSYRYRVEDGPLVFAGFLIRVRPNPEQLVPSFLAVSVTTAAYWSWVRLMSMRSGQPGINGNEYASLPLRLPGIEEQVEIVTILSDMDTEITALEIRRIKTRALKQAMMQELLTGRTRLV